MRNSIHDMLMAMRDRELFHEQVFARMASVERDSGLKASLLLLSRLEHTHATWWHALLKRRSRRMPSVTSRVGNVIALRRLLGVALTMKLLERAERDSYLRLDRFLAEDRTSGTMLAAIKRIRGAENKMEHPLEARILSHGSVLSNIRDVTFGMNDGLVEVLAAVAGLGAALQAASLVFIAGLIVAVSGTLSMSAGAYLATNYESNLGAANGASTKSASRSAYYVGLFYFIGAVFPVAPFALGIGGYSGIVLSTIATAAVLTVVSSLMAVVSDVSISRSVAKTLAISLLAVAVTVILGAYTRNVLHINI